MLEINVEKKLGEHVFSAKLAIPNQGITALWGVSGAGKSTFINLIAGLLTPDQGSIHLNGRTLFSEKHQINLPIHKRRVGYVFQDARLFPHYSVQGNLCYGLRNVNKQEFEYIVALLGLEKLLKRYPITLSGGEKQRVAIGRALLTDPEILLMDEPFAALDLPRKKELLDYLEQLAKAVNIPIVYVSHSLDELLRLAHRVVLLENCQVKAYDQLENIWQHPLFAKWQIEQHKSAVLSLPVFSQHPVYKMTALSLPEQQLWVNGLHSYLGESLRICIQSRDVSIALIKAEHSSIRNILTSRILDIVENNHGEVDILLSLSLNSSQPQIWSTISQWSLRELQLQRGQHVFAQIKAVSVIK